MQMPARLQKRQTLRISRESSLITRRFLFQRQDALDSASLKEYATELGLDRTRFDAALDKGTYADEVQRDLIDGETYGVDQHADHICQWSVLGTLSSEALREAIDRALGPAASRSA